MCGLHLSQAFCIYIKIGLSGRYTQNNQVQIRIVYFAPSIIWLSGNDHILITRLENNNHSSNQVVETYSHYYHFVYSKEKKIILS
jgi:hypothetical protein